MSVRKTRNILMSALTIVLCLVTVMSIGLTGFSVKAANDNDEVSGTTKADLSFTVTTGNKTKKGNYFVLSPEKGVLYCNSKFFDMKSTSKNYGFYFIYITNEDTGYTSWTSMYKKDVKITLKANTTYTIKVEPRNYSLFDQLSVFNTWEYTGWKKHASWSVDETKGIKSLEIIED